MHVLGETNIECPNKMKQDGRNKKSKGEKNGILNEKNK
jgi:hypothetical protein